MKTEAMKRQLLEGVSPEALLEYVSPDTLQGYLNLLLGRRGMSVDVLAGLAALNRASLFKILNGTTKNPLRNVLFRLALALGLGFEETQLLLKLAGRAPLSGERKRDVFVSDGIIHRKSIDDVCAVLRAYGFSDLYGKD